MEPGDTAKAEIDVLARHSYELLPGEEVGIQGT
jgi:hypothetical protein